MNFVWNSQSLRVFKLSQEFCRWTNKGKGILCGRKNKTDPRSVERLVIKQCFRMNKAARYELGVFRMFFGYRMGVQTVTTFLFFLSKLHTFANYFSANYPDGNRSPLTIIIVTGSLFPKLCFNYSLPLKQGRISISKTHSQ